MAKKSFGHAYMKQSCINKQFPYMLFLKQNLILKNYVK